MLGLLLCLLTLVGCPHRSPRGAPVSISGRQLAVLPAPSQNLEQADQALAAAQVVAAALEAQHPSLSLRDVDALLSRGGAAARCLLRPDWDAACLTAVYSGPWLQVRLERHHLVIDYHPGMALLPQRLLELPPDEAVEVMGPALLQSLHLTPAPAPLDPQAAPTPQEGRCLDPQAFPFFGAGIRALLTAQDASLEAPAQQQAALTRLEEAHRLSPTLLATAWLSRARLSLGRAPEASATFGPTLPPHCGLATAYAARGACRLVTGQLEDGVADLGLAARQRPFSDDSLARWADGLALAGRYADSAQVYRRALALAPDNLQRRRDLAEVLTSAGRPDEARSVLVEGQEHCTLPEQRALLELDLGRLAEAEEDYARASAAYQRGLNLLGEGREPVLRSSLLNGLGVSQLGQGDAENAARALEGAVRLRRQQVAAKEPDALGLLANSLYNLGVTQARLERWTEATATLEEAAGFYTGEDRAATLLDLAELLQAGGRASKALPILEALAKENDPLTEPQQARCVWLTGLSLAGVAQEAQAIPLLEQAAGRFAALGDRVSEGQAWFNVGTLSQRLGQRDSARAAFLKARAVALKLGDQDSVHEIEERLEDLQP